MAPPARIERALKLSGMNPTRGPMIVGAARSAAVIYALWIVDHLSPFKKAVRCVFGGALSCCKCATWRQMDGAAHAWGCPVALCLIDSPLTPFYAL